MLIFSIIIIVLFVVPVAHNVPWLVNSDHIAV